MNNRLPLYDEVVSAFAQDKMNSDFSLNKDLQDLLNSYEKIVKPDFLFILDLRNPESRIVFQKNYKLFNNEGTKDVDLEMILGSLDSENLSTLLEIDIISAQFIVKYFKEPFQYLMHVCLPVELVKGNKQHLLRTGTVLSMDKDGIPHFVLGYFNDMTKLSTVSTTLDYFISSNELKPKEIADLEGEFTKLLKSKSKLTKREGEILDEIKRGLTSEGISNKLNISKATVDTHRQNMIKKYKVSNILELIQII